MNFQIVSDGACDLPKEVLKENNISVVPFYVSFGEEELQKEASSMSVKDFYKRMVDNPDIFPKTSLPSVNDYIEVLEPYIKENIPVICICIDLKISGSYNSASMAKSLLEDKYKDAKIKVIDSTVLTAAQGVFVMEAVRMRNDNIGFEEAYSKLEEIKSTGRIHFTVGNVEYLKHGGRIGRLAGFAAGALGLKPLIVLENGDIYPGGVARSRKKSISQLMKVTRKHFEAIGDTPDNYSFVVGYGYDEAEGYEYREKLFNSLKEYSNIDDMEDIKVLQIGATTGVHTGPYALGHGFVKRYDK
ncbi:DegV family protein [uncultured Anaerofustis sp.]|uniref:DegV family protein n=1 Tax=uncultured Anaerofustis sp. TaxID=904996 RepID=UPI0025F81895|nr:DegV family protein [uncultured Anaerofustis sp.]